MARELMRVGIRVERLSLLCTFPPRPLLQGELAPGDVEARQTQGKQIWAHLMGQLKQLPPATAKPSRSGELRPCV